MSCDFSGSQVFNRDFFILSWIFHFAKSPEFMIFIPGIKNFESRDSHPRGFRNTPEMYAEFRGSGLNFASSGVIEVNGTS